MNSIDFTEEEIFLLIQILADTFCNLVHEYRSPGALLGDSFARSFDDAQEVLDLLAKVACTKVYK